MGDFGKSFRAKAILGKYEGTSWEAVQHAENAETAGGAHVVDAPADCPRRS